MQSQWITWIKPHPDGYRIGDMSLVRPWYADRMISGGYALRSRPHVTEDTIVEEALKERGDFDENEKEAPITVHNHYYNTPPTEEE